MVLGYLRGNQHRAKVHTGPEAHTGMCTHAYGLFHFLLQREAQLHRAQKVDQPSRGPSRQFNVISEHRLAVPLPQWPAAHIPSFESLALDENKGEEQVWTKTAGVCTWEGMLGLPGFCLVQSKYMRLQEIKSHGADTKTPWKPSQLA